MRRTPLVASDPGPQGVECPCCYGMRALMVYERYSMLSFFCPACEHHWSRRERRVPIGEQCLTAAEHGNDRDFTLERSPAAARFSGIVNRLAIISRTVRTSIARPAARASSKGQKTLSLVTSTPSTQ
jgi:hypothetical protein